MASHHVPFESLSSAERGRLNAEIDRLRQQLRDRYRQADLAGSTRVIRRVCELIGQVASSSHAVLLEGEAGVGKTRAARAIHVASGRSGAFVAVSCKLLLDSDTDAQLFGGADREGEAAGTSAGCVGRAQGGMLFLDEVADLPPVAQQRVLTLVTGDAVRPGDGGIAVRVVAATTRDLEAEVAAGRLQSDLFEHLRELAIHVPPLRERKADLPVLTELFVEQFAREHARAVSRVSSRALDMLMKYDWPGNVSELLHTIERAVVLTSGPIIHHHHLPLEIQKAGDSPAAANLGLAEALEEYEKELLQDALRQARGVRSHAARLLMTSERVFSYRLRKHRIDARRFKAS